jgi:hypothetical protein
MTDIAPDTTPLAFDGVRWTRTPTGRNVDVYGRPRPDQPIDAGWYAVTPDGAVWVVIDVLDVNPDTGEHARTMICARTTSRDLRPAIDRATFTDADVDHVSPPDRRTVTEVLALAAQLVGELMRKRGAMVNVESRWLLAVADRLSAVMEHRGWKR